MSDAKIEGYKQKVEARIDQQVAEVEKLKAQAKGKSADAKIEVAGLVDTIEARIAEMKGRLSDVAESGEDAWEELSKGAGNAWDDITSSVEAAWKKLRT